MRPAPDVRREGVPAPTLAEKDELGTQIAEIVRSRAGVESRLLAGFDGRVSPATRLWVVAEALHWVSRELEHVHREALRRRAELTAEERRL